MSSKPIENKTFADKNNDPKSSDSYSYIKLKNDKSDKLRSASLNNHFRVQPQPQIQNAENSKKSLAQEPDKSAPINASALNTGSPTKTLHDEALLLLNEDNNVMIENYMNKMGIKDKVDLNNNLNRLKIYNKILEESNNSVIAGDTQSQYSNYQFNLKLIDLSNKLLQSHQENNTLVIKLNELEDKQNKFETQIHQLQQENSQLKSEIKDLQLPKESATNHINSHNRSNININFNLGEQNKIPEELTLQLSKLKEENDRLKKFQVQVFEISRSTDQLTSSVIDTMRNVNIIIEQFNIGTKNDPALKRLIEQYFSKY